MKTTLSNRRAVLQIAIALAVVIGLVVLAPLLGVALPVAGLAWAITRSPAEWAARRRRIEEGRQRTQGMIANYMARHGLMDTPINRELALRALCKPGRRRRKR